MDDPADDLSGDVVGRRAGDPPDRRPDEEDTELVDSATGWYEVLQPVEEAGWTKGIEDRDRSSASYDPEATHE